MDTPGIKIPSHLTYTESHEWIAQDGDVCTVGISDLAQFMLGDLVFVELPEVGEYLEAGQPFGRVTGARLAAELYAPRFPGKCWMSTRPWKTTPSKSTPIRTGAAG